MTSLSHIRSLEIRLHSHILEWSDMPLQNELLFLLDELQAIHSNLDHCGVLSEDQNGAPLSLRDRVGQLMQQYRKGASN